MISFYEQVAVWHSLLVALEKQCTGPAVGFVFIGLFLIGMECKLEPSYAALQDDAYMTYALNCIGALADEAAN